MVKKDFAVKQWDRYTSVGGLSIGTLATWSTRYINDVFWSDFLAFLSPTLTILSALVFQRYIQWENTRKLMKYMEGLKHHLEEELQNPNHSEEALRELRVHYQKLSQKVIEEHERKIEKVRSKL